MIFPNKYIAAGTDYADLEHFVPAPIFRKKFTASGTVKAEIIIGAAGFYKLFINGTNITKGELAPYISNTEDIVYYDRYDVTDLISEGENVIAVLLGNGFQNNPGGAVWDFEKAYWRSAPKFALRASIIDRAGGITELETDESFKVCASPILFDDYRCGEYYDARLETDDIYLSDYDDGSLKNAIFVPSPKGEKRLCTAEPVRFYKELKPVSVTRHLNGRLYDFGENNTGVCRLSLNAKAGQKIILRYGEWLDNGTFSRKNISFPGQQTALQEEFVQKSEYICRDGEQTHIPSFIYNGFRYVYVEGITDEQATEELLTFMCMTSDFGECGSFSCSDETVNKLQKITRRSDRSCFIYFPNDCPQREKNGWTADAALSCEHMLLNFKPEKSLTEWLRNIVCAQDETGALPGIVPTGGWGFEWGNGPAWDAVCVNLPYFIYKFDGDTDVIRDNAAMIISYFKYTLTRLNDRGLANFGLGDWVDPFPDENGMPRTPLEVTSTAELYDIGVKAAFLFEKAGLEKEAEFARDYAKKLREAFRRHLIDFDTMTVSGENRTAQAAALCRGLFDESEVSAARKRLIETVRRDGDINTCGMIGLRYIFHALTDAGETELAYKIITGKDRTCYGYWVEHGATSLWETFDSTDKGGESQNHHFLGDISSWMIRNIAGINVNPDITDISSFKLAPKFIPQISSAAAYYDFSAGRLFCSFEKVGSKIILNAAVPQGVCGELALPEGYALNDGQKNIALTHGNYRFTVCKG